jgi:acyl carrier protein
MQDDSVYSQLTDIFREVFDDGTIVLTPETTAADIRDWDSANHVNLVVSIESRMGIRFKTIELESLHNVGHLAALVKSKLDAKRSTEQLLILTCHSELRRM